jgi:hypothetical protein
MSKHETGAPRPPTRPLTRDDVLPIAAVIYAATIDASGLPELGSYHAERERAVTHAIELAKEVDRQLREP